MSGGRAARANPLVAWIATLSAAAAMTAVPHGRPAFAAGQSVNLGVGLSTYYDDNLLLYSDEQLAAFHSGLSPGQFSIRSGDDLVYRPSVSLAWERAGQGAREGLLRVRGTGEFHNQDATADFRSWSAIWRESFSRGRRVTIAGYGVPRFYLRQLFDEDAPALPTQYRRAEFSLAVGSIAWRQQLARRLRGELAYRFERRSYNPNFVERTSNTHQGLVDLEWYRLPRRGKVDLYGGYRISDAKAEDGDEVAGVAPDDPDVSYHGIVAGFGGSVGLAKGRGWTLAGDGGYELGTRDYGSDRPADRYHFNRTDLSQTIDLALRWSSRQWSVRGFYRFDHNHAELGAAAPPSADTGSYTENQVGVALNWTVAIWRQTPRSSESEGSETP